MSFLLDALKKSEAQRKLGEVPTIHSTLDEPESRESGSQKLLVILLVIIVFALIAWMVWEQYGGAGSDTPVAEQQVTETPATETQEPAITATSSGTAEEQTPPAVAVQGTASTQTQQRTPVEAYQAPPQHAPTGQDAGELADDSATLRLESAVPAEDEDAITRQGDSISESRRPQVVAAGTPAATPAATNPEPEETTPAGNIPHQSAPITFWELPQQVRSELPEFRVSVYVYAEQPEDRFMLLNGRRVHEGELIATGLVLEEIRREGAVFSYEHYRFMVER